MVHHIVVVERLLDHHEVEAIERGEVRRIPERVGGIGVDHQRDRAEPRAEPFDGLDVPARLDLDLDALIARLALDGHSVEQLVERVLDADRDAGRDRPAPASKRLPERLAVLLRVEVPRRHLDDGLGHVVATDARHRGPEIARVRELAAQHERREKFRDHVPDRFRRFAAVVGVVFRDGLAPALRAVAVHGDEHEHAIVGPREAGFEVAHQRQPQQSNVEAVDCHERMAGAARQARIAQPRRIIACRP